METTNSTSANDKLEETTSNTRPVKHSFSHRWTIEDFSVLLADTSSEYPVFRSAPFSSPVNSAIQFVIKLYPKGRSEDSKDHLATYLELVSSPENKFLVRFMISLVNSTEIKRNNFKSKFHSENSKVRGWSKFILKSDLMDPNNGLLNEDRVTIHGEVTIFDSTITFTLDPGKYTPSLYEVRVLSKKQTLMNLNWVLECDKQTDVTVVISNGANSKVCISAHKFVLVGASSVLEAMFKYDTTEKQSGVVSMTDVSAEVGELFIRYLYSGKVNQLETYAEELFVVADKYNIDLLKRMCIQCLCSQMSTSSMCHLLLLSDRHSSTELQQSCIEYITNHANEVIRNEDWPLMSQLNNTLKVELFCKMANKHPIA